MSIDDMARDKHGKVVLWQRPNIWLTIWAAAVVTRLLHLSHSLSQAIHVVGTGALIVWALLEIWQGVNYFRRGLGAVVLIITVASILGVHL